MTETVHRCPPGDAPVTPCCGRSPFELPDTDRMTEQAHLVTCQLWADPSVSVLDDLRALQVSVQQEATQPVDDHGLWLARQRTTAAGVSS